MHGRLFHEISASKVHDLKASKGLDSTDLRLLKMGCGTTSFAAVRNHTSATDTRPDEDTLSLPAATKSLWECRRVVDAIEILCAQKPRTYEGLERAAVAACCPSFCEFCEQHQMLSVCYNLNGHHGILIFARLRQCVVENAVCKLSQQTNEGYFRHLVRF